MRLQTSTSMALLFRLQTAAAGADATTIAQINAVSGSTGVIASLGAGATDGVILTAVGWKEYRCR